MGFEDEVEQSLQRPCRQTKRQVQADMRTHLIHRPARDIIHRSVELEFPSIGFDPVEFSCCCRGLSPGPTELGAVHPDAVHDHGQPTRQRPHLDALDQVRILDAPSFDHPGRAFAILLGGNDASMDLAKHRQGVQIEHPGCFSQRDFATLGPLAVRVDRDAVRIAEAPHTRLRPPVQSACSFSCSVETGNGLVRH